MAIKRWLLALVPVLLLGAADSKTMSSEDYGRVMQRLADRLEHELRALPKRNFTSNTELARAMVELTPDRFGPHTMPAVLTELGFTPEQMIAFVKTHPQDVQKENDRFGARMQRVMDEVGPALEKQLPPPNDVAAAIRAAHKTGHALVVFFSADWCVSCQDMTSKLVGDPRLADLFKQLDLTIADLTTDDAQVKALKAKYHILQLPTLLVLRDERELLRVDKVLSVDELRTTLAPFAKPAP